MNKLWFDESLSDAVDDPRLHEELVPSMYVEIEKKERYRLNGNIVKGLEKLGHNVIVGNDAAFAVVQAVYRKPGKGIYAKSDPRKYGVPAGVSSATSRFSFPVPVVGPSAKDFYPLQRAKFTGGIFLL